ncbi:hypothetical protein K503DRAFT_766758 [Rhizopogon vinicolor AM-OR11-026]|uniref:PH domain-containing protein n=1 Tax=Rhizopogon vinicolor AM-OR11-026 TaxID=1314800 RepID=A0A1B7NC83_9AGAM|nr:hypothetical protein K503DRAFT_766758 [Rhizopogon vinicolor AM-OR11-026]
MALATNPGSRSPQWDNRHRGFISPAELQQLRQASPGRGTDLHEFQARQPATTASPPADNNSDSVVTAAAGTDLPFTSLRPVTVPQPTAAMSHIRTSSFFSFRKHIHSSDAQHNSQSSRGPNNPPQLDPDFAPLVPQNNQQRAQTLGPLRSSSDKAEPLPDVSPAARRMSIAAPPLHPEIRSIVQLTLAHARKIYFSGPLVKRVQRQPDGHRPKDDAWTTVWAQLGGTTLSIWDMKEVEEANKQGREVPPTYVNMTDAFVQVLGSVTAHETQDHPRETYSNVLTLNTAGSNLILFSCPSDPALVSWATALRLSAWEKSRLEEIYTAHLMRITLNDGKDARTTLVRGRMEGWVRIRVAGQTDWKRMWMVVSSAHPSPVDAGTPSTTSGPLPPKKRMSNLFSREHSPEPLPATPLLALYAGPKPKDKKHPLLTLREMSQAFAVYPERPELINRSTLMKLEGLIGDEDTAGGMKRREGWLLVMPELEAGNTQASEMLKWLIALHDAFELYGRPKAYTWDPRDPTSMMFAYPIGPGRDLLFLDREVAECMDPRDDRTSAIRSRLLNILHERMSIPNPHAPGLPALPPSSVNSEAARPLTQQELQNLAEPKPQTHDSKLGQSTQLPLINFDSSAPPDLTVGRGLSPIAERSNTRETLADLVHSHSRSMSEHRAPESMMISSSMSSEKPDSVGQSMSGHQNSLSLSVSEHSQSQLLPQRAPLNPVPEGVSVSGSMTGIPQTGSPPPTMSSRSDSKLTPSLETTRTRSTEVTHASVNVDVGGFKLPLTPESPGSPAFSTSSTTPSSGMGKPTSPGMSLSSLVAPVPIRSPASRSPPPVSRPISSLTSPYSPKGKEKELPSILDVDSVQLPPRALSPPPPSTTLPLRSAGSPPLPPKARSPTQSTSPSSSSIPVPVAPVPVALTQQDQSIFSDALFYMQQLGDKPKNPPRRVPTTISERSNSDESSASDKPLHAPLARRGAPVAFAELGAEAIISEPSMIGPRPPLGRRPSGARVQPSSSRGLNMEATSFISSSPEHLHTSSGQAMADPQKMTRKQGSGDDVNADALAALSFLASATEVPAQPAPAPQPPPPPPRELSPEPAGDDGAASGSSEGATQYRSSFAPSKQAAQRKARAEAQQRAVLHKPGRANGKRMSSGNRLSSGWNESSDEEEEEEEEEEEDDEDADSDDEPPSASESKKPTPATPAPVVSTRPLRPSSAGRAVTPAEHPADANAYSQSRRNLPPVPTPQDDYTSHTPPPRRLASDQHMRAPDDAPHLRPQSEYPPQLHRPQPEYNQHAAARQTIWTQVLDSGRAPGSHPQPEGLTHQQRGDPFIQLEPASHSMTKAFTPHGLLSAGMQDKQDRSAKRQEELARETGGSLINVPNKPPPPQTGLLGAITAHERERKREGGVGAALTEREREKRQAEERQRKIDEYQRQQLDMQSMYGQQQQFPAMMGNPMMGNPMMMGMNPMMTGNPMMANANPMMASANPMMTGMGGGYMGYPNMMPGFGNPQFFAQQAAQAAYQQAMMAVYSSGGSQLADGMHPAPMNPMMTGGGMGFDPRMSMMGMPVMGTPMGMNGMGGGMGMGMGGGGMGGMGGMGMQMTGGSAFDPRFSPNNLEDLRPPGSLAQGQRPSSSRNSSAGQGSPAGPRPVDARESPKH